MVVPPLDGIAEEYLPALVLRQMAAGGAFSRPRSDEYAGALLFSDLSRFTERAVRLARRGAVGAEVLTELLNRYFGRLNGAVSAHGGDILKMAGDSVLAFWPAAGEGADALRDAALRAAGCALAIREALAIESAEHGEPLESRVGVGVGTLRALHVGGVRDRWEFLVAGGPLEQVAAIHGLVRPGEVVISAQARALVGKVCAGKTVGQGAFRLDKVVGPLPGPAPAVAPPLALGPAARELCWDYIPGAVRARLNAGRAEWLAELRRVTTIFVSLAGLAGEGPEEMARAHEAMRVLQETLYRFEGSINKVSVDEKGLCLLAALGLPPLAHEDDAARAVLAAREACARLAALGARPAIGIATGRVYCGEVGGPGRHEYTMIGDTVNLSARLMQHAGAGGVLCDVATALEARKRVEFQKVPGLALRGLAGPVTGFRPSGSAALEPNRPLATLTSGLSQGPFVGRDEQSRRMAEALEGLARGEGGTILIEGEAGLGKSRLVAEFVRAATERGALVLLGKGDAVESGTPYFAWRPAVARLLHANEADTPTARREIVLAHLAAEDGLARLAPLLNMVLPLGLPENDATAPMNGQARADNTNELLVRLVAGAAARGPTVVVLEDAHWLDSTSWGLASLVSRRVRPILLVVAMRPMTGPSAPERQAVVVGATVQRLLLGPLAPADALAVARDRLGVASLPPSAAEFIVRKAQGNPLFCSALALAMRDLGLLQVVDGACFVPPETAWGEVPLPGNIEGVITRQLDALPEAERLALKAASVIGRRFNLRLLAEMLSPAEGPEGLARRLDALEEQGLVVLEQPGDDSLYSFQHDIVRDAIYGQLPFERRRACHRQIAAWHEQASGDDLSPYYGLLAHHWRRAGDGPRAIDYLDRAGEQSLRGGAYGEAVSMFRSALEIEGPARAGGELPADDARLARWRARLGEAYLCLGRLSESREHSLQALALARRPAPRHRAGLVWACVAQAAIQSLHRAFPERSVNRHRADAEERRGAARVYEVLAQSCYYAQEIALGTYSGLRALNLAESAGPSPELARGYATMCVTASLVPLPALAGHYAGRARATAEAIDDESARAWVELLSGMYWLTTGDWARAERGLARAVESSQRLRDWRRWEEGIGELARFHYLRGDFVRGEEEFRRQLDRAEGLDHLQARTWGANGLATGLLRRGRTAEAVELLEGSPAVRGDGAIRRADAILGHGLLAAGRLRLNRPERARRAAATALAQMEATRPMVNYNLEGYAGAAEVFLALWEEGHRAGPARAAPRRLRREARRACSALWSFAWIFPNARPRAWLFRGRLQWLSGRCNRAWIAWRVALKYAQLLDMPYDIGLAHHELGRRGPEGGHDRQHHLELARETFARLGAMEDLSQVESALARRGQEAREVAAPGER